jgi:hypothetical protein
VEIKLVTVEEMVAVIVVVVRVLKSNSYITQLSMYSYEISSTLLKSSVSPTQAPGTIEFCCDLVLYIISNEMYSDSTGFNSHV